MTKYEEMSKLYDELKAEAKKHNIVYVTATQAKPCSRPLRYEDGTIAIFCDYLPSMA